MKSGGIPSLFICLLIVFNQGFKGFSLTTLFLVLCSLYFVLNFHSSFFILHPSLFFLDFHESGNSESDKAECHDEEEEMLVADTVGNES